AGLSVAAGIDGGTLSGVLEACGRRLGRCRVRVEDLPPVEGAPVRRLAISLDPRVPSLDGPAGREHLEAIVAELALSDGAASLARRGLEVLLAAEADAHRGAGTPHLHEAQDILIDVAGAAWCLERLGGPRVRCLAPVPAGGGVVRCSHGVLAVPAPATARILAAHGIPWAPGPVDRELLTPTGAALLAALRPDWVEAGACEGLEVSGWGAGTLELGGPANRMGVALAPRPRAARFP
ncbi:MAG: DUF111 family protein, partial [Deltaproteobacteria bacterium]|nr:DUF111 family protein [Deltaproteobacteria bacterium]